MAANPRELQERWTDESHVPQLIQIIDRLGTGASVEDMDLPRVHGRVDLRGIRIPNAEDRSRFLVADPRLSHELEVTLARGRMTFRNVALKRVDFSFGNLSEVDWEKSSFRDTLFRQVKLVDGHFSDCVFEDVDFQSADLKGSSLGGYFSTGFNAYRRVSFVKSDLRNTYHRPSLFEDCDFSHAKLVKVDFDGSRFVRCRFAGRLRQVEFHGRYARPPREDRQYLASLGLEPDSLINPMDAIDFSEALLDDCLFTDGVSLSGCRFPDDKVHIIIKDRARLLGLMSREIRENWPEPTRSAAISFLRVFQGNPEQKMTVVNRLSFEENPYISADRRDPWLKDFFDLMGMLAAQVT